MTTTPSCEIMSINRSVSLVDQQISEPMAVFLAEELLPMMAGFWPASAVQLTNNAKGNALAYGVMLKGYTAKQIKDAVVKLAEDSSRQFAPRPIELQNECLRKNIDNNSAKIAPSRRMLEMQVDAMIYQGVINTNDKYQSLFALFEKYDL